MIFLDSEHKKYVYEISQNTLSSFAINSKPNEGAIFLFQFSEMPN